MEIAGETTVKENKNFIDEIKGGMRIYWNSDIGFGTLDIVKVAGNDGEDFDSSYEEIKLNAYTETMDCNEDKSFIRKTLDLVADYLNVID